MNEMIERAALAMLTDIGNGNQLDLADPHRRITTVQLSSADFLGMAEAAIAAMREPTGEMLLAANDSPAGRFLIEALTYAYAAGLPIPAELMGSPVIAQWWAAAVDRASK